MLSCFSFLFMGEYYFLSLFSRSHFFYPWKHILLNIYAWPLALIQNSKIQELHNLRIYFNVFGGKLWPILNLFSNEISPELISSYSYSLFIHLVWILIHCIPVGWYVIYRTCPALPLSNWKSAKFWNICPQGIQLSDCETVFYSYSTTWSWFFL